MRVLAFDTTCAACSVALWHDDTVEAAFHDPTVHGQAELLMPAIERVMAEADVAYSDIDRIGVTVGPGSFTGVRVGLATARALAVALDRPAIGILTSAVLAQEAINSGGEIDTPVAVAIDARRAELYLHCFDRNGAALEDPQCLLPEDAAQYLAKDRWQIVGDGAAILEPLLELRSEPVLEPGPRGNVSQSGPIYPDATLLASMVATQAVPEAPPQPVYVRPPDAVLPIAGGRLRR